MIFSIDIYLVLPRVRHRKPDNILKTGLKDIYVKSLFSIGMNRDDPYQKLRSIYTYVTAISNLLK